MTEPSPAARTLFDGLEAALKDEGVSSGMAYGHRALKHDGHGIACLSGDAMAFRLPPGTPAHAEALAVEGSRTWAPSTVNVALPDWVVVPSDASARWLSWARAALASSND
jgi:hypothetical protein